MLLVLLLMFVLRLALLFLLPYLALPVVGIVVDDGISMIPLMEIILNLFSTILLPDLALRL